MSVIDSINADCATRPHAYGGVIDESRTDIIGLCQDDNLPHNVGRGFRYGTFENASDKCQWQLLLLLAQVSEASYRRGVRQAIAIQKIHPEAINTESMDAMRYADAHVSPCLISGHSCPAISMLLFQYHAELSLLGFSNKYIYPRAENSLIETDQIGLIETENEAV